MAAQQLSHLKASADVLEGLLVESFDARRRPAAG